MTAPRHAPRTDRIIDEQQLVARIRAGDVAAFEHVFREYFGPLCSFMNGYVRSREVAEELMQDLFLRLWSGRATLDVHQSLRIYLFSAARNRALNHVRRARREWSWADRQEAESTAHVPGANEAVRSAELSTAIRDAVAALSPRCRMAFVLTQQQRLSHADAAAVMGITAKTVAIQVGLARQTLRRRLAAFFGDA